MELQRTDQRPPREQDRRATPTPDAPVIEHPEVVDTGGPATPEARRQMQPSSGLPTVPTRASVTQPQPALPNIPRFQQFSYLANQPLTPQEIESITLFHSLYMQAPGIRTVQEYQMALVAAKEVLPLFERQYTLACQDREGEQGQHARTVKNNLEWVKALIAQAEGA